MGYKKIGQAIILEADETIEFEDLMNRLEEAILEHIILINGRASDKVTTGNNIRIIVQRKEVNNDN